MFHVANIAKENAKSTIIMIGRGARGSEVILNERYLVNVPKRPTLLAERDEIRVKEENGRERKRERRIEGASGVISWLDVI